MINFVPIFPLGIVVYPNEKLNLHIFEESYKQLVNICFSEQKPFGIPTVINDKISDTGTLVTVVEIVKTYEDGRMDIRTLIPGDEDLLISAVAMIEEADLTIEQARKHPRAR